MHPPIFLKTVIILNVCFNMYPQPITDILTNCPPDAYEDECQTALKDTRSRKEKLCNGYSKHVAMHNRISKWANSQSSIDYIDEMINMSTKKSNDSAILDLFENLATKKYRSTFQELRNIFMMVKNGIFNCNTLTFANSPCA